MTPIEVDAVIARACRRKRRYYRDQCRRAAVNKRAAGRPVSPYRCPFCRWWHLGHVPSMESLRTLADAIRAWNQQGRWETVGQAS